MTKKKRRGRRHRARASAVRPTQENTALHVPELSRPSQVIEPSPAMRGGEPAERHRYALADVKHSLVIGGAMFTLLIVLYLLPG